MTATMLYLPLNTLKPLAPDIWMVDGPIVSMSAPLGLRVPFPTRMTVVKLAGGGLWCHSPIAPDRTLFAMLDALGPIQHLVSPNKLHYTHIAAWKLRYPSAVTWASPGVRERTATRHEAAFDADLGSAPLAWANDIDQLCFKGSWAMEEFVFFHRSSETLILTDLIENFEAAKLPALLRWVGRLGGVLDPDGKTPMDWRTSFRRRKSEARACLATMLAWHPKRVILAHGRCYVSNAEDELRRAFRWLDG